MRFLKAPRPARSEAHPDNRIIQSRTAFAGAFGDLARARRNWQLVAFGLLLLELLTLTGLLRLSLDTRITPYVVEVDRLGRPLAFGPAEKLKKTDQRLIVAELTRIIRNLRTVYADPGAQRDALYGAYAYLGPSAKATLDAYFTRPENDPRLLAQDRTRSVDVESVLQIPDSATWRVTWTEREQPRFAGLVRESAWEAHLTLRFVPPKTDETIQANPLGLYVTSLTWTRIRQGDAR